MLTRQFRLRPKLLKSSTTFSGIRRDDTLSSFIKLKKFIGTSQCPATKQVVIKYFKDGNVSKAPPLQPPSTSSDLRSFTQIPYLNICFFYHQRKNMQKTIQYRTKNDSFLVYHVYSHAHIVGYPRVLCIFTCTYSWLSSCTMYIHMHI